MGAFIKGLLASDRDPNSPQFAHFLTFVCTASSIAWGFHYNLHTHLIPDAVTLGGLGAFAGFFYGLNRFAKTTT